ncbi:radical SAM family heme chaperone HemW [soil metagenome]
MPSRAAAPAAASPPAALYVHVPFCLSICPYCDFVVHGGADARGPRSLVQPFVEALISEIELRAAATGSAFGPARPPLASVYIGGGTPSLLPPPAVSRLLQAIDHGFGLADDAEVTLEANPGPADRGDLAGFRAAGVNRLSVGAQSMIRTELRTLGRRHGPRDVARTVSLARRAGLRNVGLDLLYDVPGQTARSWHRTVQSILRLEPDHVSAYALALEDPTAEGLTGALGDHLPVSAGARRWRDRARVAQDADLAADLYLAADRQLEAAGLSWYELSNWARPGYRSRHNLAYWQGRAYEAVGPGAHAFDGARTRRWNAARLAGYLAALRPAEGSAPRLPPGGTEMLDEATAAAERAILGLRLREGVRGGPASAAALAWAQAEGLVVPVGERLSLTARGRLLANELFLRLLPMTEAPAA